MLFFSFFKTLVNTVVIIELKNDIRIRGTLKSVDQYLNVKLEDIEVLDLLQYPHLSSVKNIFVRGSVVRYIVLPSEKVDRELLEDATRRGEQMLKAHPTTMVHREVTLIHCLQRLQTSPRRLDESPKLLV
ncbi:U6 snRNA-associated Sm-like protein LSm2 [Ascosphaera aggregata]|nr:U6 snRNA-associated Sm-like protein LSm2 [Ascosphaera aggregata]